MKIRTETDFQDALDKETSWRKKELSSLKLNIQGARRTAQGTALRAGIALLYAHWEGLVKNVASYYLNYVSFQRKTYGELKLNFLALALKNDLNDFEETNKASRHNKIVSELKNMDELSSRIPYKDIVKTGSNLNSEIFVEIMETIGLDHSQYECEFLLLDSTLLKMRNEIAHGEHVENMSLDEKRFNEIYDHITTMMTLFVNQVSNAVSQKEYLRN